MKKYRELVLKKLEEWEKPVPWFYIVEELQRIDPRLTKRIVNDLLRKMNADGDIELEERGSRRRGHFLYVKLPRKFEGKVFPRSRA